MIQTWHLVLHGVPHGSAPRKVHHFEDGTNLLQ